jgi:hypothetical protein
MKNVLNPPHLSPLPSRERTEVRGATKTRFFPYSLAHTIYKLVSTYNCGNTNTTMNTATITISAIMVISSTLYCFGLGSSIILLRGRKAG